MRHIYLSSYFTHCTNKRGIRHRRFLECTDRRVPKFHWQPGFNHHSRSCSLDWVSWFPFIYTKIIRSPCRKMVKNTAPVSVCCAENLILCTDWTNFRGMHGTCNGLYGWCFSFSKDGCWLSSNILKKINNTFQKDYNCKRKENIKYDYFNKWSSQGRCMLPGTFYIFQLQHLIKIEFFSKQYQRISQKEEDKV